MRFRPKVADFSFQEAVRGRGRQKQDKYGFDEAQFPSLCCTGWGSSRRRSTAASRGSPLSNGRTVTLIRMPFAAWEPPTELRPPRTVYIVIAAVGVACGTIVGG